MVSAIPAAASAIPAMSSGMESGMVSAIPAARAAMSSMAAMSGEVCPESPPVSSPGPVSPSVSAGSAASPGSTPCPSVASPASVVGVAASVVGADVVAGAIVVVGAAVVEVAPVGAGAATGSRVVPPPAQADADTDRVNNTAGSLRSNLSPTTILPQVIRWASDRASDRVTTPGRSEPGGQASGNEHQEGSGLEAHTGRRGDHLVAEAAAGAWLQRLFGQGPSQA